MSLSDTEDETKKGKLISSKRKSLSSILGFIYNEFKLDIKFLLTVVSLYTQSEFQRVLGKLLQSIAKSSKLSKKVNKKGVVPEEYKLYITMAKNKIFELLMKNNEEISKGIYTYIKKYNTDL